MPSATTAGVRAHMEYAKGIRLMTLDAQSLFAAAKPRPADRQSLGLKFDEPVLTTTSTAGRCHDDSVELIRRSLRTVSFLTGHQQCMHWKRLERPIL